MKCWQCGCQGHIKKTVLIRPLATAMASGRDERFKDEDEAMAVEVTTAKSNLSVTFTKSNLSRSKGNKIKIMTIILAREFQFLTAVDILFNVYDRAVTAEKWKLAS